MRRRIRVFHTENVPIEILYHIREGLERIYHMQTGIVSIIGLSPLSYDDRRGQYLTYPIFQDLNKVKRSPHDLLLAVIQEDLFVPEMNFVFGQANPRLNIALVSLKRLDPLYIKEKEDMDLFKKRALKESVHEIGHLLGIGHCPNRNCAMHFSNSLADTDRKGEGLCKGCEMAL
ncbi:MAG: archaemetzincin family Zn-dependent metalloprotease [Thermoplasmatota archaeon]